MMHRPLIYLPRGPYMMTTTTTTIDVINVREEIQEKNVKNAFL